MYHLSSTEWIVFGALSLVWATFGYLLSEQCRKTTGRTPWGMPSLVWAFLWFLSLALGLVLYLIYLATRASSARRMERTGGLQRPASAPMAPQRWDAGSQFPAYPRPANSQGTPEHAPAPSRPALPVPPSPGPPAPMSPPAWFPDPSGRFHYRWWDGSQWTTQVSTDGQHLIDTHPDQRIGPY